MPDMLERLRGSVTAKLFFIGLLSLALLVPMQMIESLIRERSASLEAARAEVANSWGQAQTIGAPMLLLPLRYTIRAGDRIETLTDVLYVLPESVSVEGSVESQTLTRGIYEVPVYGASLSIEGVLPPPELAGRGYEGFEPQWGEAQIALPISDARPLREPVRLRIADAEAELEAGGSLGCFGGARSSAGRACDTSLLVVAWSALGLEPLTAMQSFSLDLTIRGTEALRFLPAGDVTHVALRSDWPSPSFTGAFLPDDRDVSDAGFTGAWQVLGLGRGYPSEWRRSEGFQQSLDATAFGVDLLVPVGVHEASLRAAKYAVLFFGLTFLLYFLFEVFAGLRLHALQYLSVGAANCLFFLLLLALAEHVGFGLAYVFSALASTALIGVYSAAVLGAGRRAVGVVGMLALVYGYLYVTLKAEDHALLFGALGLFAVLAAFMLLTRHVDWHALRFEMSPNASA